MAFPIFSLLAAAGTAIANGVATSRANKINQRNYEEVRNYNRPISQMGRFRSAGLNPNLIYTQTNEAEQRPEWNPPQYDFGPLANAPNELASYQNIKESQSRVDNFKKQNQLLDAQIIAQNIENYWNGRIKPKELAYLKKQIDLIDKQIANIDWEQEFKDKELTQRGYELFWDNVFKYLTLQQQGKQFQQKLAQDLAMFKVSEQWKVEINRYIQSLTNNGEYTIPEAIITGVKQSALSAWENFVNWITGSDGRNYHWNINNINK